MPTLLPPTDISLTPRPVAEPPTSPCVTSARGRFPRLTGIRPDGRSAAFASFQTQGVVNRRDEDFAIPSEAGMPSLIDGVQNAFYLGVMAGGLDPDFPGDSRVGVEVKKVGFVIVFLTGTTDVRDGESVDMLLIQRTQDGFDNFLWKECGNEFHERSDVGGKRSIRTATN